MLVILPQSWYFFKYAFSSFKALEKSKAGNDSGRLSPKACNIHGQLLFMVIFRFSNRNIVIMFFWENCSRMP